MDEINKAREVLSRERKAVLSGLRAARKRAERMAEERKGWKAEVHDLINRGRACGLRVNEMAEALGVSRQWATQLMTPESVVERARGKFMRRQKRGGRSA